MRSTGRPTNSVAKAADHTSSHDKISGGNVGVAVIATGVDTVGTLVHDKIDSPIPVQELSCCGFSAEAVVID
jgi:hypothetical protein